MPIYEYQCEKCHHHLEALQKISDKPLRECPECGKHKLKRLVSAPMFRLSGSGWYETDFKSDKETKRNLAGRDEAPAPDSPVADKGDKGDKADKADKADKSDVTDKADKGVTAAEKKPEAAAPQERTAARKSATRPVTKTKPAARKPAAKKTARKR